MRWNVTSRIGCLEGRLLGCASGAVIRSAEVGKVGRLLRECECSNAALKAILNFGNRSAKGTLRLGSC